MSEAIVSHSLPTEPKQKAWWEFWRKDPKYNRLRAALCGSRQEFHGMLGRSKSQAEAWWADCARRSLETAEAALERRDYDGGWGALHDARRFLVFGMDGPELLLLATTLNAKTKVKLKGWRLKAANGLFRHIPLADWTRAPSSLTADQQPLLRHVVGESLCLLDEHSDNLYHRLGLVGLQLNYLVLWCAVLIGLVLFGSYLFIPADPMLHWGPLAAVALAGALGGVVSAMIQLSRVGETKIPDALMHGVITSGRPLVGAASALFIYAVMQSGVISLIQVPASVTAGLVLAFVAGFSDRFVLGAITKVAGEDKTGGGSPRESSPIDDFDNGPGRDEEKRAIVATDTSTTRETSQNEKKPETALPKTRPPAALPQTRGKKSGAAPEGANPPAD